MLFDWIYGSIHGSPLIYETVFAKCLRFLSRLIGCDIFDNKRSFTFNIITYVTLIADAFFLMCCFYTVYASRGEAIKCVCYTSFGIMVAVKCSMLIRKRSTILENIEVIEKIYVSAELMNSENYDIVDQCSKYALLITRSLFTLYLFCASVLYPIPFINFLITGHMELMSPVLIPGIDPQQLTGYGLLYLFHCHSVFFGSVCFATCDILFGNSALHVLLFSGMMAQKFERISGLLEKGRMSASDAQRGFSRMVLLHRDFLRYVENMDRVFFFDQTVQMACSTLCIVSLICSFFLLKWLPAYFLIFTTMSQLFMFCSIGTIIEVACDRIYRSATMSSWYLLPTGVQRQFGLMILFMERAKILTIAGVWPLNVSTFVSIMRLIYSFAMMVINFVA